MRKSLWAAEDVGSRAAARPSYRNTRSRPPPLLQMSPSRWVRHEGSGRRAPKDCVTATAERSQLLHGVHLFDRSYVVNTFFSSCVTACISQQRSNKAHRVTNHGAPVDSRSCSSRRVPLCPASPATSRAVAGVSSVALARSRASLPPHQLSTQPSKLLVPWKALRRVTAP